MKKIYRKIKKKLVRTYQFINDKIPLIYYKGKFKCNICNKYFIDYAAYKHVSSKVLYSIYFQIYHKCVGNTTGVAILQELYKSKRFLA